MFAAVRAKSVTAPTAVHQRFQIFKRIFKKHRGLNIGSDLKT